MTQAVRATKKQHATYVVLDVSESMRWQRDPETGETPQDIFSTMIEHLMYDLKESPEVATTTWMSLVTFADEARQVVPMTPLDDDPVPIPPLEGGRGTDYAAVLHYLTDRYEEDRLRIMSRPHPAFEGYEVRVAAPLVFFITDGAPWVRDGYQDDGIWMPARDRLVGAPLDARIIAFGLAGSEHGTLHALATGDVTERNAFIATTNGGARTVDQARSLAHGIKLAILDSVKRSVSLGTLVIRTPLGMRRVGYGAGRG